MAEEQDAQAEKKAETVVAKLAAAEPLAEKGVEKPSKPETRVKKEKKPGKSERQEELFDASSAVVGRLAALAVKKLLSGKRVVILNAEKAVMSGDPKGIAERYSAKRGMQNKSDPEHSPKWPRRPDFLYKKIVSGMLPRKPKGRSAFKHLRIYVGVPTEYSGKPAQQYAVKNSFAKSITLAELCERLGWKSGVE